MRHNPLSANSLICLLENADYQSGTYPSIVVRNANGTVLPFTMPTVTRDADGTIVINVDTAEVGE